MPAGLNEPENTLEKIMQVLRCTPPPSLVLFYSSSYSFRVIFLIGKLNKYFAHPEPFED
jgi:hypothetical protein